MRKYSNKTRDKLSENLKIKAPDICGILVEKKESHQQKSKNIHLFSSINSLKNTFKNQI